MTTNNITAYDTAQRKYLNDPLYRALVDSLVSHILNLDITPSELREAAMYACIIIEERKPIKPIFLSESNYQAGFDDDHR